MQKYLNLTIRFLNLTIRFLNFSKNRFKYYQINYCKSKIDLSFHLNYMFQINYQYNIKVRNPNVGPCSKKIIKT